MGKINVGEKKWWWSEWIYISQQIHTGCGGKQEAKGSWVPFTEEGLFGLEGRKW